MLETRPNDIIEPVKDDQWTDFDPDTTEGGPVVDEPHDIPKAAKK